MGTGLQKRHHLLIAGTGRAGTSLLVKLLTACGLDTEQSRNPDGNWHHDANAGLETIPLLPGDHPYVVKSAWSYQFIDELLECEAIHLDAVIIPVRNLAEAAASRIIVELQHIHRSASPLDELKRTFCDWASFAGGVTYPLEPIDQARTLGLSLHLLLERLMDYNIPVILLKFPRFTHDFGYLHKCLSPILPDTLPSDKFERIAHSVIDPDKVRVSSELSDWGDRVSGTKYAASWPAELPSRLELDNLSLKRELNAVREAKRMLATQRDALAGERDALGRERDDLAKELQPLRRECETLRRESETLRQESETLRREWETLNTGYSRVLRSWSWRVTAPLRGVRRLFARV